MRLSVAYDPIPRRHQARFVDPGGDDLGRERVAHRSKHFDNLTFRQLSHGTRLLSPGRLSLGGGRLCRPLPLRAARHSSKRRTTTKNDGTNSTAKQVEASMPLDTAMPIDLRELAPAPVANTSGITPRMKANEVMRMGRKRARAASSAASMIG